MQKLLTGKRRLPGFGDKWRICRLGELFDERCEVDADHLPLLAITGTRGIIPASEIERKDSSSENKTRYKVIRSGDIGYNTMRMWQGVSAVSSLEGIVSPAYTICIPKASVNAMFMGYFFKYQPMVHLFWRHSQGMVDDTLSLKYHNFARISVLVPDKSEQCAIADVLATADREIASLEAKFTALKEQKKGLMQKLLTREIRVS
jgi:type I restriction enzyme S subunit